MEMGGSSVKPHQRGESKKTGNEVLKLTERIELTAAERTSPGDHSKNPV